MFFSDISNLHRHFSLMLLQTRKLQPYIKLMTECSQGLGHSVCLAIHYPVSDDWEPITLALSIHFNTVCLQAVSTMFGVISSSSSYLDTIVPLINYKK